jgi:uncharacterized damage-inducible protein DinB
MPEGHLKLKRGLDADTHCAALALAAEAVLSQCQAFVLSVSDASYSTPSSTIRGGTIGKHLRHTLDHFSAVLGVVAEPDQPIDYDARERNVPMETDRRIAITAMSDLRDQLAAAASEGLERTVRVRVMIDAEGRTADLGSTLGRELAFATHHAVHHQAMMKAIATEFGVAVSDQFGKANSTVQFEASHGR